MHPTMEAAHEQLHRARAVLAATAADDCAVRIRLRERRSRPAAFGGRLAEQRSGWHCIVGGGGSSTMLLIISLRRARRMYTTVLATRRCFGDVRTLCRWTRDLHVSSTT
jgi:hypothetical protein